MPIRTRRFRGTTSAYAENTHGCICYVQSCGNYLRVRGEYSLQERMEDAALELPPRTRRIPDDRRNPFSNMGTTSAYAENTVIDLTRLVMARNYLRVRGEYRSRTAHPVRLPGTTSAYAENTPGMRIWFCAIWNYLRVRGEYVIRSRISTFRVELPPRTRRIHINEFAPGFMQGTTSAYAENTPNELGIL